jgi:hypothetical protein
MDIDGDDFDIPSDLVYPLKIVMLSKKFKKLMSLFQSMGSDISFETVENIEDEINKREIREKEIKN